MPDLDTLIADLDDRYQRAGFGEPVAVLPDLYLVKVPLPANPLKAVNSYFILGSG